MKYIELTQGQRAKVDDEDYGELSKHKWQARWGSAGRTCYAMRNVGGRKHRRLVYMHRAILNAPCGAKTDHVDHDGLNNQRDNIRLCTHMQNMRNMRKHINSSSHYKGVSHQSDRSGWRARIKNHGNEIPLGHFASEEAAARAYDAKARELFGEFALTNFPLEETR